VCRPQRNGLPPRSRGAKPASLFTVKFTGLKVFRGRKFPPMLGIAGFSSALSKSGGPAKRPLSAIAHTVKGVFVWRGNHRDQKQVFQFRGGKKFGAKSRFRERQMGRQVSGKLLQGHLTFPLCAPQAGRAIEKGLLGPKSKPTTQRLKIGGQIRNFRFRFCKPPPRGRVWQQLRQAS